VGSSNSNIVICGIVLDLLQLRRIKHGEQLSVIDAAKFLVYNYCNYQKT